jgi:hypothetical protein
VNVARELAGAAQYRQACALHIASFEQWGYPCDYQGQIYSFQKARNVAYVRAHSAQAR